MIYTITANPAIDYHMDLTDTGLAVGQINRSKKEEMFPGGKGLNVSVILSRLGIPNTAWAFAAGKTGRLLEELTEDQGCSCDFLWLEEGETRINVKLDCSMETAVNGIGPAITREAEASLLCRVDDLKKGDILVLSGNLQTLTSGNLYMKICGKCAEKGVRTVVDTEGQALRDTFISRPFLIKPNREELTALFDTDAQSREELIPLMKACREEGVRNVLLTLGGDGALLLTEDGRLLSAQIENTGTVVSTVGAGDSSIAGFLAGLSRHESDYGKMLQLACAAGSASAYRSWLAEGEEIEAMVPHVRVTALE